MDNIDIVGSFSTVLGIVSIFITVDDLHTKITISAFVLIVVLIAYIIKMRIKWKKKYEKTKKDYNETIKKLEDEKKELNKKIEDAEIRNSALSKQYKIKKRDLDNSTTQNEKLLKYWFWLNSTFQNAIQGSKRERFDEAYKMYRSYTKDLTQK